MTNRALRFPSGGAASRSEAMYNAALLVLLGGGLVAGTIASGREWRVHVADDVLSAIDTGGVPRTLAPSFADPSALPPRAALSMALTQARAAAVETDPHARAERIAAARLLLARVDRGRPGWPVARVAQSFIASIDAGPAAPEALGAFKRSFIGGAFLHDAAPWRIRYGLDHWNSLDAGSRRHVIAEAAWYSTTPEGYVGTLTALVGQPAEVPVMRARADLVRSTAAEPVSD